MLHRPFPFFATVLSFSTATEAAAAPGRSTLTRSTALVPVIDVGCAQSTGVTLTHGLTALGLIVQQQTLGAVGMCISLCHSTHTQAMWQPECGPSWCPKAATWMLPLERTATADTPPFLWLLCGNQVVAVV